MDSLTPGVLSKVTEEHRSAFLQVIEIVSSLDDYPFRTRGFFLKLSDSLHSAYVSIPPQDLDLIFYDKIQMGHAVRLRLPLLVGDPCPGASLNFKNAKKNGLVKQQIQRPSPTRLIKLEIRKRWLNLDSARRAWDHSPSPTPKATPQITSSAKPKQSYNKSSHNTLSAAACHCHRNVALLAAIYCFQYASYIPLNFAFLCCSINLRPHDINLGL
ncbi:hypothetical protein Dsin_000020 [Dipteronia sinensis]|uniref:DUF936 domain-containing protein n=1 Tax=Dipteronia sinensis TaxID=43782 RepID=A0AAD9Z428_9ROSI|nr:hypothetical protein Dsin_000020 [Dipteronia sinensis]